MSDIVFELLAFILVTGATLVGERTLFARLSVRRRLGRDVAPPRPGAVSVLKEATVTNRVLAWVQAATKPTDPNETTRLRRDLALAGFESPAAPIWYVICRFSLAIGLPILLIAGSAAAGKPLAGLQAIVAPLALCGMGLLTPFYFVRGRASSRRADIEQEFPDALDLMVVCVEAGLGLEATFVRVATEVRESHPRIAYEFGRLTDELSAGKTRPDALRAMAARVDVDSVKSFVALLIQSNTLGVSVAQGLRTYSAEMREARFLKAEEKAMRIPVLMTLPIVICFMPVVMVALLLPPGIDVVRTLAPAMKGGQGPAVHATAGPPGGAP